jgi:hypothetical protein
MAVLRRPVHGVDEAMALLHELVAEASVDGLLVVGLDRDRRPSGVAVNSNHRAVTWLKVWELADLAAELGASALLLGLFAGGPSRPPSRHEIDAFVGLCERARRAQVVLLDCIVVRDEVWWSLRARSLVDLDR